MVFTRSELSSECDVWTVDESELAAGGADGADPCLVDGAREKF